ncbi:glutathione S-transferase family protein [Granulosicoccus antarcticus]|uniref:Glutathione S-transferase GstB n=1 Tax=Granulosicoccus antarcticus IMCC3135 TaxID=1192854 RepID=A0A2Z2NLK9_9GAMM|nr:glutathione S-transferase family protein [Granulosicoccus antarcticus]ASJ72049.1 Glutathione S-transferase GstB [Granulosicoccus antarcticus IMCC3135]
MSNNKVAGKLELFADPISINCRKVIAGLALMDIDYELTKIGYFAGEQKSAAYLKINPNAKLPALRDGDLVIWESNAILQYVANKYGKTDAYPAELGTRADVDRWLFWECGSWFASCYTYTVENCVKPILGAEPDPAILAIEDETFHKLASILDARLGQMRYVCGHTPTIADIAVAAPMHLHKWQQLPLENHSNINRWMSELIEPAAWWRASHVGEGFTLPGNA